ncbi:MAG: 3'-5' exonuclease [Magnetococcales bacterium]|nr:3'-5' exonuclease [Magnetococcales bacterium]NGZ27015.1 3'-5' exonuclease [Magnetococcales bacterium]
MIKSVPGLVWAFDVEWVPDPVAGRILHDLPWDTPDAQVMGEMWKKGGATPEEPYPFLKTALCRIVSIAVVTRLAVGDKPASLQLLSLPRNPADPTQAAEDHILETFLTALGDRRPMLVGYNSHAADLKALIQRSVIRGISAASFCRRPSKPWEGADYFSRGSDWNVDLKEILSGWGQGSPSLHEMVVQCGIPGKMEVAGHQVGQMWLDGGLDRIVAYNEYDALTTYLLWLRIAHFGGFFTPERYQVEQQLVRELIQKELPQKPHLQLFLDKWEQLREITGAK